CVVSQPGHPRDPPAVGTRDSQDRPPSEDHLGGWTDLRARWSEVHWRERLRGRSNGWREAKCIESPDGWSASPTPRVRPPARSHYWAYEPAGQVPTHQPDIRRTANNRVRRSTYLEAQWSE